MAWLERNSEEVTAYVDIESDGLCDILRVVLHEVKAISLMTIQFSSTSQLNLRTNFQQALQLSQGISSGEPKVRQLSQYFKSISANLVNHISSGYLT